MELVLKVFDKVGDTTPALQVQNIFTAKINFDINNFHSCELQIPVVEGIKKYSKIELYEVDNNLDILIFEGYIFEPVFEIDKITIIGRSYKDLMNYKKVLRNTVYTSETISYIIEDILDSWYVSFPESRTFVCDDLTTTITKQFKLGDNLYDVIEELSGLLGKIWDIVGQEIRVLDLIGEDKTDGLNYTALIYNGTDPYQSNISKLKLRSFSTVANVVIGVDNNGKTIDSDSTSIGIFGPLGETKSFREGDRVNQTAQYLESKKEEQRVFELEVEKDLGLNVGDKCKLIIEKANDYLNFSGDVFINTKEIQYLNKTKQIKIGVADLYVYFDTIQNRLRQYDKNIKLLQI